MPDRGSRGLETELLEYLNRIGEIFNRPLRLEDVVDEGEVLSRVDELYYYIQRWVNDQRTTYEAYQQLIDSQLEELSAAYEGLSALFEINKVTSSLSEPWSILGSLLRILRNAINFSVGVVKIEIEGNVYTETLGDVAVAERLKEISENARELLFVECDPELGGHVVVPLSSELANYGYLAFSVQGCKKLVTAGDKKIVEAAAQLLLSAIDRYVTLQREFEKKRFEEQLFIARSIQQGLLPSRFPKARTFDIFGKSVPAVHVGGDYYDVLELDDGSMTCCIADVSGKGLPAALIMSSFRSMFRLSSKISSDLRKLAQQFDTMIHSDFETGRFITAVIFKIDPNGRMQVVNAGHDPVYVITGGRLVRIESTGTPLGILGDGYYDLEELSLRSGDAVVTFTDGVVEARNVNGEEYGFERLESFIVSASHLPAFDIADGLLRDVLAFSTGRAQHDDTTVLVVKYQG